MRMTDREINESLIEEARETLKAMERASEAMQRMMERRMFSLDEDAERACLKLMEHIVRVGTDLDQAITRLSEKTR